MDTCGLRNGLKLSFVGFECSSCQRHFSSWPLWAIKEKTPHNISRTPRREKGRRQGKETERHLWPKTKHIPRCAPTKAGSRPLNQRRSVEGAPIKQIFKEGFIHNTSCCLFSAYLRCNWFPPSHFTALFWFIIQCILLLGSATLLLIWNPIKACRESHWAIYLAAASLMWCVA